MAALLLLLLQIGGLLGVVYLYWDLCRGSTIEPKGHLGPLVVARLEQLGKARARKWDLLGKPYRALEFEEAEADLARAEAEIGKLADIAWVLAERRRLVEENRRIEERKR